MGLISKVAAALYPGLLTPVFVACSTNAREGLVKLITCSDVPGCWMDIWRSGTFPQVSIVSTLATDRGVTKQPTSVSLVDVSRVQKATI